MERMTTSIISFSSNRSNSVEISQDTPSAVLAVGGGKARLLAGAGSCTASSLAGAEAEAIGSELLRRRRGRATQARQRADV